MNAPTKLPCVAHLFTVLLTSLQLELLYFCTHFNLLVIKNGLNVCIFTYSECVWNEKSVAFFLKFHSEIPPRPQHSEKIYENILNFDPTNSVLHSPSQPRAHHHDNINYGRASEINSHRSPWHTLTRMSHETAHILSRTAVRNRRTPEATQPHRMNGQRCPWRQSTSLISKSTKQYDHALN